MAKLKLRALGKTDYLKRRLIWFCAFICFGGMAVIGIGGKNCLRGWQARSWVATPCTIENSGIKSFYKPGRAITYTFSVDYRYSFGGTAYSSQDGNLDPQGAMDLKAAGAMSNLFPAGTTATCYVNPQTPAEAVLDRTVSTRDMVVTAFGGVLMLGGLVGVTVVRRKR